MLSSYSFSNHAKIISFNYSLLRFTPANISPVLPPTCTLSFPVLSLLASSSLHLYFFNRYFLALRSPSTVKIFSSTISFNNLFVVESASPNNSLAALLFIVQCVFANSTIFSCLSAFIGFLSASIGFLSAFSSDR